MIRTVFVGMGFGFGLLSGMSPALIGWGRTNGSESLCLSQTLISAISVFNRLASIASLVQLFHRGSVSGLLSRALRKSVSGMSTMSQLHGLLFQKGARFFRRL